MLDNLIISCIFAVLFLLIVGGVVFLAEKITTEDQRERFAKALFMFDEYDEGD